MLLIKDLRLKPGEDEKRLKELIEKKLKTSIDSFEIVHKSLDARKDPVYVYTVAVQTDNENRYLKKGFELYVRETLDPPFIRTNDKCIIVGYGPSGIFAAYRLCQAGFKVAVFEKGRRISQRQKDVERFFKEGILDERSNVQFGEGGAGTFSDAKLTTRIRDRYIGYVTDILIEHGADHSIGYENHAHIGTDRIRVIIQNITDYLIERGVEFHFEEEVKDLIIDDGRLLGVRTDKADYSCDHLLLGIGHSAHESFEMLERNQIYTEKKDIAIGFRVEHPQSMIDERQTGSIISEANEYFLRYKGQKGVYSFCMCPGGIVIPAMSQKNTIVTNGMSYSARDSLAANSAILIQVGSDEFEDGLSFLQNIERKAYDWSGSYKALAQNISDFMNCELHPLIFDSTYPLGTVLYDFNNLFSDSDLVILKEAFLDFDRKIPGFIDKGIMVGPETRSSSPVRIKRNEKMQSVSIEKLYPMGEGAGYAGGIMSCSLDGIRVADAIIDMYEQI